MNGPSGDADDVYSAANIARSRSRAAQLRERVASGELSEDWGLIADQIEAYSDERERAL